jgi:purine-binding chemotaxis protein CheW
MARTHEPLEAPAAATQYCTFVVSGLLFGVPAREVQEVIRSIPMTRVPGAPAEVEGLINLRGQIVTAIDLRRRLGLDQVGVRGRVLNVVIQSDGNAVSLLVDEIGGVVDVRPEEMVAPPSTLRGPVRDVVAGVYQVGDRLLLALDTKRAIEVRSS